jgi:hypothetical protein
VKEFERNQRKSDRTNINGEIDGGEVVKQEKGGKGR